MKNYKPCDTFHIIILMCGAYSLYLPEPLPCLAGKALGILRPCKVREESDVQRNDPSIYRQGILLYPTKQFKHGCLMV